MARVGSRRTSHGEPSTYVRFEVRHRVCRVVIGVGGQEGFCDFDAPGGGRGSKRQRKHVGVVPTSGSCGGFSIGAQRRPTPRHLVRRNRNARSGEAPDDTEVRSPIDHGLGYEVSGIDPRGTNGDIENLVSQSAEMGRQIVRCCRSVVAAVCDLHARNSTRGAPCAFRAEP